MKKVIFTILAAVSLMACSTTTADLRSSGSTEVLEIPANYQEVYRRVNGTVGCTDGAWAGAFASFQVDRQLYTELGYGEISLRLSNVGVNNYYMTSKITRINAGTTQFEITTGNSLASDRDRQSIIDAATGTTPPTC